MLELVLIIIGCYASAAFLVHLAHWIGRGREQASRHYVLIADQRQRNMEWYLRSMFSFSQRIGREVRLTVVDRGATEDTKAIVERWSRSGKEVLIIHESDSEQQLSEQNNSKRTQAGQYEAIHLMWILQAEGVVSDADHAVLVDLQNPADMDKMPF